MPKINLTDLAIKRLPAPENGQTTYWDQHTTGFGVRVSQGGTKSFVIVHGVNRQRETLGNYPVISLKQARDRAKVLMAQFALGLEQNRSVSYKDGRKQFLEACEAKNKQNTVDYYRKRLDAHFKFGRKRLDEITRLDIQSRVRGIKTSASEQHHAFVVIRTFLNWAVREQLISVNPIASMQPPKASKPRERVLSDQELAKIFATARQHPPPFGAIVSLLILTGMRRNEVASLKWDWIDKENSVIELPSSITKNKRTHAMPFTGFVQEIFDAVPETPTFLFPSQSRKGTVFNGWGKSKARFDEQMEGVDPYTLHDLRRTFATVHARIGTPIHVTEKLLNHVSGTISGVAAVYNRHTYLEEMRSAQTAYEQHIEEILGKYQSSVAVKAAACYSGVA